jgi:hypothetical protein
VAGYLHPSLRGCNPIRTYAALRFFLARTVRVTSVSVTGLVTNLSPSTLDNVTGSRVRTVLG